MNKTDIRILELIQKDARISIVDLSEQVNLTQTPCARRVQNLEKRGLINSYVGLSDQDKIGLPVNAFVELRLVREHPDVIVNFENTIADYPEVMECYALSGGHTIISSELFRLISRPTTSS
ncbi:MAG: Lrp/AsnC family transcriptional regulator [bacterium]|nr:Lrp/AsnC family transcriptional regulator [Gammaproteobacteria bacterium]